MLGQRYSIAVRFSLMLFASLLFVNFSLVAQGFAQDESASETPVKMSGEELMQLRQELMIQQMSLEQLRADMDSKRASLEDQQRRIQRERMGFEEQRGALAELQSKLDQERNTMQMEQERLKELQQKQVEQSARVSHIFEIKNADVNQLAKVLRIFTPNISPNSQLGAIGVQAPEKSMPAIEDAINRFDVPPAPPPPAKNIQLIAYLVEASEEAREGGKDASEVLGPVVNELQKVFGYRDFRLLDTLMLRCRDGNGARVNGYLPSSDEGNPIDYSFIIGAAQVTSDTAPHTVRIDGLQLSASASVQLGPPTGTDITAFAVGQTQRRSFGLFSDIDVKEGQKVVVGKADFDSSPNAIFAVVTVRVVD